MRVCDVYHSSAALSGDNSFESAKWFYLNLNRALDQINRLRPQEATVRLFHKVPDCALEQLRPRYVKAGDVYTALGATGVTFRATGSGKVKLTASGSDQYITWSNDGSEKQKLCSALIADVFGEEKKDITLTVTEASAGMMIGNLAAYRDPLDTVPEYGWYIEYKMADMVDDFSEFAKQPLMVDDVYAEDIDYRLGEKSILLSRKSPARDYYVIYRRYVRKAVYTSEPDSDTAEVDIRSDLEDLLPLLVGYLCNVYADPEVATIFKRDYDEQVAMYLRQVQVPRAERLVDRTGWLY